MPVNSVLPLQLSVGFATASLLSSCAIPVIEMVELMIQATNA